MNEQELKKIIEEIVSTIRPVIREEIKVTVNGKIDRLTGTVQELREHLEAQDIAMAPAIETLSTIKSGRNFVVWAAPAIAAVGAFIAYLRHG